MSRRLDKLSVDELEQALYRKKRAQRQQRLQRLKEEGRVVEVAGVDAPTPRPPTIARPSAAPTGALSRYTGNPDKTAADSEAEAEGSRRINWRWVTNKMLLLVEVGAVVGIIAILVSLVDSVRELNQDAGTLQQQTVQEISAAVPAPTTAPLIDLVVLPTGHKPPIDGQPPQPGEAGEIPDHLLPILDAYVPPPLPTPSPQQPRSVEIPEIGVNHSVVQGDDWEQLKKGIGHHIESALPGQAGNMVLSAHNDIYGEIFRHLDKLSPGDEVFVSNGRERYTYVINEIRVVAPTDVWVMDNTDHASLTLISCYPYLVNNKRIVVFADLVENATENNQQG